MGTTSNPILFALRDLGTSVRTIFQDEASRRQAALAAQGQENEQRRALESLRLTGEQQLARLGIEEAKTRFEVGKGQEELALRGREVGARERETASREQFTTQQVAASQAQEARATELQPHLIATERSRQSAARASEQAAGMQRQVEGLRLEKERLALQIAQGEMKPTTLGAYLGLAGDQALRATGGQALPRLSFADNFIRGLGLDPALPLANAHAGRRLVETLKEILPQNTAAIAQLGAQQQLAALPEGSPQRQQLQQQYDMLYTPPRDRNAQANTYIKGVEQGVFPPTFIFDDYERVYGGRQQESNYEAHELFFKTFQENLPQAEKDKFAKASATDKDKLLKEWNERVRTFRQANGVVGTSALWLQQAREEAARKAPGGATRPPRNAPSTPPVPVPRTPEQEESKQYREEFDRLFPERAFTGFNPLSLYLGRYVALRKRGQTPEEAKKSIEALFE